MPPTSLQKQALGNELVDVMDRLQDDIASSHDHYEALITQPTLGHLIIKLQPANVSEPAPND